MRLKGLGFSQGGLNKKKQKKKKNALQQCVEGIALTCWWLLNSWKSTAWHLQVRLQAPAAPDRL